MQINSELIKKIGEVIESSWDNTEMGRYVLEHDLGSEIELVFYRVSVVSYWTLNGTRIKSNWSTENCTEPPLRSSIAGTIVHNAIIKADQEDMLMDMLEGTTTNLVWDTPLGITVKFSKEIDSQTLLICQTSHPDTAIYGFEEAINQKISIGPDLLTPSGALARKVQTVLIDCVLADIVTVDVQF